MKKPIITLFAFVAVICSASSLLAGYYEQGRKLYTRKKYDQAKEMFLKAAETNDLGNAYYFLGEIEKIRNNYHQAEEYYKTAITRKSTSRQYLINSYWNALVLAEQRENYQSVIKICRDMWNRTGDASARKKIDSLVNKFLWTDNTEAIEKYNAGIELKKTGKSAEAIDQFNKALGIAPSFLAPRFETGMIAYNRGEMDQAYSNLGMIADKIPFYADVQMVLADISFSRHNYQAAINHYDKVIEYGFLDSATEQGIRIKRGTCYYNINDMDGAVKEIDRALRLNPGSMDALLLMSAVRIKREQYKEALTSLQKANGISPDNPEIQYQLGSVYYRQGDKRYATHFDRLFSLAGSRDRYPEKYRKVFLILARNSYENKNFGRVISVVKSIDPKSENSEAALLAARSRYHLKEYDSAIEGFGKISLGNDDKYLYCRALALAGKKEKAKSLLVELVRISGYESRAKQDAALSGLIRDIEKDTELKKIEPEKKTEEQKPPVKKEPETENPDNESEEDE